MLLRDEFLLPPGKHYLCGHSLGAQPRRARELVNAELDSWATDAVDAHFKADAPWYSYHELLRDPLARLVGARPAEVVAMNGLTVNLHLLLASFFRPHRRRTRILIDEPTFPSDRYAVLTHLAHRGLGPEHLLSVPLRDIERTLSDRGDEIATVLLAGLNFLTGEVLDVKRLADAAHRQGCLLGLDLAHAVGNIPLSLHDDGVDFAVWCSYKYLNSGPGAVAGAFVHEKHGNDASTPRLGGWWGNDPATRFRMHLEADFIPVRGADGWQLSNPPILALAPLRASLELFDRATIPSLRTESLALTSLMLELIDGVPGVEVLSPREPARRGNMVCLRVRDDPRPAFTRAGVVCDFREPNVVRASACPLYNTREDVEAFVGALRR